MTRAVLVSSCGDPFLDGLVFRLFKERWYSEVDAFWININNHNQGPQEVIGESLAKLSQDPKVHIIYHPRGIGNGKPITEMVSLCEADLFMLLENDGFIFTAGKVNECFQKIESDLADVVGSPRFSCGTEVADASKKKYNLDYSGYGDVGCNMWPNFFFCKRKDLLRTDMDFGSHTWQPGEYSKELDHTFKEINHGDTFVWACVQLRALGLRFHAVPQYHCSPTEIEDKKTNMMNWHQGKVPYWLHGGSLSAGWGGYLSGVAPDISNENAIREMETRVSWWRICSDIVEGFDEFKQQYRNGIEDLTVYLDRERIQQKYALYRELLRI